MIGNDSSGNATPGYTGSGADAEGDLQSDPKSDLEADSKSGSQSAAELVAHSPIEDVLTEGEAP